MNPSVDFLFETDKFNLSRPKPEYINDTCYGDDVAVWLQEKLTARGIVASDPAQEDWGWYLGVACDDQVYMVAVGGNADEAAEGAAVNPDKGEWRIGVEKNRSLKDKLLGRNALRPGERIVKAIQKILQAEPGIKITEIEDNT